MAVTARTEGFTLRRNVDPDEPASDLYSACVYVLGACMTEAGDGDGDGDGD
jgi:hypothetical protein